MKFHGVLLHLCSGLQLLGEIMKHNTSLSYLRGEKTVDMIKDDRGIKLKIKRIEIKQKELRSRWIKLDIKRNVLKRKLER